MTRPIRTLLIANRGEIAVRIAEVCRELGIRSVAVYSDPDRDLPHVRAADVAVPIGGRSPAESYLDAAKVLAAAARSGADAIHPGYGFLSESPDFAQSVIDAGLVWVGPTSESMRSMALKVEARRIAGAAGVPVVPGAELDSDASADQLRAAAEKVGFPVLVKASAGGGGRGMRVVESADSLVEAVESARREAQSAFGDATVFLERYLAGSRHVEVQVFGDQQGTVLHLGERDCSVQRRHQKVIEETPSPGLTDSVRESMLKAAVALARSIKYVGAGTVEFIVAGDGAAQEFFFLEMNTRLQVEHPVTELAYEVPLIEWQVRVAEGDPLLVDQSDLVAIDSVVEVRLYAEDPARDYAPGSGVMRRFVMSDDVRVDPGFESGSEIGTHYDPMLAKLIAAAPSRREATLRLAGALRAAIIHGPVTNRDSLVAVLESDDFLAGRTSTAFLDEHPELLAPKVPVARERLHLAAAVIAAAFTSRVTLSSEPASATAFAPTGWRNVAAVPQARAFLVGDSPVTVVYEVRRDGAWRVGFTAAPVELIGAADIEWLDLPIRASAVTTGEGDVMVDLEADERVFARVIDADDIVTVHDGVWNSRFGPVPRFAGEADDQQAGASTTPVPGTITLVLVSVGDMVVAGQTLVVLEAMKMEHRIVAAADGVVDAVFVEVGQSVDAHQVVVTVEGVEAVEASGVMKS